MSIEGLFVGVVAALAVFAYLYGEAKRATDEALASATAEAEGVRRGAELEATAQRRAVETAERERALVARAEAEAELSRRLALLDEREEEHSRSEAAAADYAEAIELRRDELAAREAEVKSLRDRAEGLRRDVEQREEMGRVRLEERSGTTAPEVVERLSLRWREDAVAEAAQAVRLVDQHAADPQHDQAASRLLQIATARYKNHFLTERNISRLPINPEVGELLMEEGGRVHQILQEVSNVQLQMAEEGDGLRLDGLDGVGREVARRAIARLNKKKTALKDARENPEAWAKKIRAQLDREIVALGKKACVLLEIKPPHPEIISLVGQLNYRTSYTQNQWLHAVEASFLCGIMASELGLDEKVARRATLFHDIGKALTHEIQGSHAVIGADIARRLGEEEIIANAIGAHHLDEPMNSAYAFLVAAADAMSGARPGARREQTEGYGNKLQDLERIGGSYRGVERAFAVHGGRELRVYVREKQVSDLEAVKLSSEIAGRVSEEMTFPGQIKVTVIRAVESVATAS